MIKLIRKVISHFKYKLNRPISQNSFPNNFKNNLNLVGYGHINGSYSLAAFNRAFFKALHDNKTCKLLVQPVEGKETNELNDVPHRHKKWIQKRLLSKNKRPGLSVSIFGHYPLLIPENNANTNLVLFFWEESLIPESFVKTINSHYDGVLVATNFVKKILIDSGCEKKVTVIGSGLTFTPRYPKTLRKENKTFSFLHVSSCFPRKGIDALLEAYAKAFTAKDNVKLIIKSFPNPHNEIDKLIQETFQNHTQAPFVEVINKELSERELSLAYFQSNCIVLPTRGEGLNLPAAEAMFCKKPLITTEYSAHLDFCNVENSWLTDYKFSFSKSHLKSSHSLWADPNVNDLAQKMRGLFENWKIDNNKKNIESKISQAEKDAHNFFNWSKVARKTLSACQETTFAKNKKNKINLGWLSPWGNKCGIAEYSNFILNEFDQEDISINIYALSEGQTYHNNDKFNISYCSELDKNQINIKHFINKIIEDKINVLVIQYNFNFFPISKFASYIEALNKEKIKIVLVFHATKPLYTLKKTIFSKLKLCDRILVHTVNDMNFLKSYGLTDNITFLPHGVINLVSNNSIPTAIPKISENKLVIGSYGFFMPHKGIFQLINAFKKILNTIPNSRLILINAEYAHRFSQEEIKRCMFHAKQLGIFHLIEWHTDFKSNSDSFALIDKCDIMVFPYQKTEESSSAAVRMALASRKPVLTTPLSIFDDIQEITYQLKGIEIQDITSGILNFLALPTEYQHAIINKQKQWLIDYDWKKISQRLQGMLKGLVING